MSRDVKQVLESGYLTKDEAFAIKFEEVLEANEETMGDAAALAVTCGQLGVETDEYTEILIELPDGNWWEAKHLPVKQAS